MQRETTRSAGKYTLAALLALGLSAVGPALAQEGPPPDDYEGYDWQPPAGGKGPGQAPGAQAGNGPFRRPGFQGRRGGAGGFQGGFQGGGQGPGQGQQGPWAQKRAAWAKKMAKRREGGPGGREGMGQKMMARLKEIDPALAAELESLREKVPPHAAQKVVRQIQQQMRHFLKESGGPRGMGGQNVREKLQQLAVLELKTLVAGVKLQHTEVDKAAVEGQLRKDLDTLFDRKLSLQQEKVKQMEEKLAELKKMVADRQAHKAEIVGDRFDELAGTSKRFRW